MSSLRTCRILVTGSSGLIGRHLCERLERQGCQVRRFDLLEDPGQNISNPLALRAALQDVEGVVHLAAVSRVQPAQRYPVLCQATNVTAVKILTQLCMERKTKPWLIFASSREVYGNPERLPVREDDSLAPLNVYGESKRRAELIVDSAVEAGLLANICRFSNVYGCPFDYEDRVAVAFAARAARGGVLVVEGGEQILDFTEVHDIVDGVWRVILATAAKKRLPPIHFASGRGTKLRELAEMAAVCALCPVDIIETKPRALTVSAFIGDPSRAFQLLGWRTRVSIEDGFGRLVAALSKTRPTNDESHLMQPSGGFSNEHPWSHRVG